MLNSILSRGPKDRALTTVNCIIALTCTKIMHAPGKMAMKYQETLKCRLITTPGGSEYNSAAHPFAARAEDESQFQDDDGFHSSPHCDPVDQASEPEGTLDVDVYSDNDGCSFEGDYDYGDYDSGGGYPSDGYDDYSD